MRGRWARPSRGSSFVGKFNAFKAKIEEKTKQSPRSSCFHHSVELGRNFLTQSRWRNLHYQNPAWTNSTLSLPPCILPRYSPTLKNVLVQRPSLQSYYHQTLDPYWNTLQQKVDNKSYRWSILFSDVFRLHPEKWPRLPPHHMDIRYMSISFLSAIHHPSKPRCRNAILFLPHRWLNRFHIFLPHSYTEAWCPFVLQLREWWWDIERQTCIFFLRC